VLLGGVIRGALQTRLKRARVFKTPKPFRELALSPQTPRN
jgi:hypothetical protein